MPKYSGNRMKIGFFGRLRPYRNPRINCQNACYRWRPVPAAMAPPSDRLMLSESASMASAAPVALLWQPASFGGEALHFIFDLFSDSRSERVAPWRSFLKPAEWSPSFATFVKV